MRLPMKAHLWWLSHVKKFIIISVTVFKLSVLELLSFTLVSPIHVPKISVFAV